MATRKKKEAIELTQEIANNVNPKTKHPLVFISHDTRDAELAEEFSNLLKSASAGALKSFRSSDKKGTQGIEYGQEWYPAIMDKIDEASDVVCLLTQHSVDRPWILYEAFAVPVIVNLNDPAANCGVEMVGTIAISCSGQSSCKTPR